MQEANIPGLSASPPLMGSPFVTMPIASDRMTYNDLRITFKVDEDMQNYTEIVDWLIGINFPTSGEEHRALRNEGRKQQGAGVYSDASLFIMNSHMNKNIEVQFKDCFPIDIEDLNFTTRSDMVDWLEATVTFKYLHHTIKRVASS